MLKKLLAAKGVVLMNSIKKISKRYFGMKIKRIRICTLDILRYAKFKI
jgi:hypothetical protein